MPDVYFTRPELQAQLKSIQLIEDVIAGPQVVKAAGDSYLPRPDPTNQTAENKERYNQYVERAMLLGATPQTLEAFIGLVFVKDPAVTMPQTMEMLINDVDSHGLPLDNLAKKALRTVLKQSRAGILVDYPVVQDTDGQPMTKAKMTELKLRPNLYLYESRDIINWRTDSAGLTLLVLYEKYVKDDDGFKANYAVRYREYRILNGVCVVQIWVENGTDWVIESTTIPLDGTKKPLKEIPFAWIGWKDNTPNPDAIPLEALARLEIGHYRNSADYEEACYIAGQPTPVFTGLTENWVKDQMKGVARLGSRAAIPLPQGATAELLQAEPNSMPKEAMDLKERQMAKIGAKLIEPAAGQRTATEASLQATAESSILGSSATNVSKAIEEALLFAALFANVEIPEDDKREEVLSYELNTDFDLSRMNAQDRAQLLAEWQGGGISFEEYRWNLVKGGTAYLDDEEVKNQLETELGMTAPAAPTTNTDPNAE